MNVGLVCLFFHYQCGSQTSKECIKQVVGSSYDLAKKLQLWLLLKLKMLSRLLSRSLFEGERLCEKSYHGVMFSMVSQSLSQLGEILTEGCEDSRIKKPGDILGYLEKERILFRKTQRNHLDYPKVKENFV